MTKARTPFRVYLFYRKQQHKVFIMAKSIKLKCTWVAGLGTIEKDRLYTAKVSDEGNISISVKSPEVEGKNRRIYLSVGVCGEIFLSNGGDVVCRFLELKTKTLKCMRIIGPQKKDSFKPGKRYQIESGRALGGVAGRIFDDEGYGYTLYRDDVGFSCAVATFEAKYL